MIENLPNSYLLGVHLTISTHSGPQIVYSYPPCRAEYIDEVINSRGAPASAIARSAKRQQEYQQQLRAAGELGNEIESESTLTAATAGVTTGYGASIIGAGVETPDKNHGDNTIAGNDLLPQQTRRSQYTVTNSVSGGVSDSSSVSMSSYGLSDSELSTDYSDESSSAVQSSSPVSPVSSSPASLSFASSPSIASSSAVGAAEARPVLSLGSFIESTTPSVPESNISLVPTDGSRREISDGEEADTEDIPKDEEDGRTTTRMVESHHSGTEDMSTSHLLEILTHQREENNHEHVGYRRNTRNGSAKVENDSSNSNSDLSSDYTAQYCKDLFNEDFFRPENFAGTDKIFGFSSDFVAEFCSPEKELCNSKFELSIDQFCFLGLPIHNNPDGTWRKSRHKKHTSRRSGSLNSYRRRRSNNSSVTEKSMGDNASRVTNRGSATQTVDASNLDHGEDPGDGDTDNEAEDRDTLQKTMNMFHVCFIMNPPLIEYNQRVEDMYQNVVAKLALLLRYVQAKTGFVSRECSLILRERELVTKKSETYRTLKTPAERAKYMYQRIISKSVLARSLTRCVDQIHQNKIASIIIDHDKMVSLQIPIQNEFRNLPDYKQNPILPHSYLSAVVNKNFLERNLTISHGGAVENLAARVRDIELDEDIDILNFALLLLDDRANILKTLESMTIPASEDFVGSRFIDATNINSVILSRLIKQIQPTMPLISYHYIITEALHIEPSDISLDILRSCSLHLMYWRYARVIIPLNPRYVYVVSPIVSLSSVYVTDEIEFRATFPSLPPLGYFLNKLSGGGSVPTSREGKLEKDNDEDLESSPKKEPEWPVAFRHIIPSREHRGIYLEALSWLIRFGYVHQILTFVYIRIDKGIKLSVEEDLEKEGFMKHRKRSTDRRLSRVQDSAVNPAGDSEGRSASSPSVRRDNRHTSSIGDESLPLGDSMKVADPYQSNDDMIYLEYDDPELQKDYTIILDPKKATAIEKRWIYKCIANQPPNIKVLFNRIYKYFDGKTPLELIILQEGLSRHEIKRLLNAMEKYLVLVYHW